MGGVEPKRGITAPSTVRPRDAGQHLTVGPFIVDLSSMELLRNGSKICVQEKPVQLLAILMERPGQVVSRDDLRQRLWPADVVIDFEHSLNTAVKKLREALGDHADTPEFIETVSHHGYRLIAPVSTLPRQRTRSRLAVLPFENLNKGEDSFSRGLWEAMITQLGKKCTMLDVIAPLRILQGENGTESWTELSSDYLLSGSLLRSKEHVRITVRLVRSEDLCCLWCDSYTRVHRENLLVQNGVADEIAQRVLEFFLPKDSSDCLAET